MSKYPSEPIRPTTQRMTRDVINIPAVDRDHPVPRPARVENSTVLDRYRAHKTLTEDQLYALDRFQLDWHLSGRNPRVTAPYDGKSSPGNHDWSDTQVGAGLRRDRAIIAMDRKNPLWVNVVDHVAVQDRSVDEWAAARQCRHATGMQTLRAAADFLAKHYG